MKLISIVVPLYNEEENVANLYAEVQRVKLQAGLNAEFVFVDDGSRDQTVATLTSVVGDNPGVVIVRFRKMWTNRRDGCRTALCVR